MIYTNYLKIIAGFIRQIIFPLKYSILLKEEIRVNNLSVTKLAVLDPVKITTRREIVLAVSLALRLVFV